MCIRDRLGADDYMVKPFLPKELSLRIGIILRRYYKGEEPIVQLAGSQIDFDRAEVIKENEHFPLTAKEHDILLALYRNTGRIDMYKRQHLDKGVRNPHPKSEVFIKFLEIFLCGGD